MTAIQSLRTKVTREQAIAAFRPPGPVGFLRAWHAGPLRSVADAYIPFLLHRVTIRNAARTEEKWLALDAVAGVLDLYGFDSIPRQADLMELETRNFLEPALGTRQANIVLCEKVRRMIYGAGFFKLRDLQIHAELLPLRLHVPYWIGFSGRSENASVAVLDATRGKLEGSKARSLFENWLLAAPRQE